MSAQESVATAVYRLYDAAGVLLYVGATNNPKERWDKHAAARPWWPAVARHELVWYPDRFEALAAEAKAIRSERPVHNIRCPIPATDRQAIAAAEESLTEWAAARDSRDALVRAVVAARVSKYRVHQVTGISRSTIDRILAAPAPHGASIGPSGGWNDH